eukprot:TRINITY_DN64364_c0_g1_i1.p1 TRINITY_DN64364_c0_g1~~TRINITY_DN64364_c0_g1_i1.p1  ORF type:complete len:476 (+),score=38.87 TRINITY_DN64364_c0_g1_i1:72-1499(+)
MTDATPERSDPSNPMVELADEPESEAWRRGIESLLWEQAFKIETLTMELSTVSARLERSPTMNSKASDVKPHTGFSSYDSMDSSLGLDYAVGLDRHASEEPLLYPVLEEKAHEKEEKSAFEVVASLAQKGMKRIQTGRLEQIANLEISEETTKELVGSLPLQRNLRSFRGRVYVKIEVFCVMLLALFMVLYVAFNIYLILNPMNYLEVDRDGAHYSGGTETLPFMSITLLKPSDARLELYDCSIPDGNASRRQHVLVPLTPCTLGHELKMMSSFPAAQRHSSCLPSNLAIGGQWGDQVFRYLDLNIVVPNSDPHEVEFQITMTNQYGPTSKTNDTYYYTDDVAENKEAIFEVALVRTVGTFSGPLGFIKATFESWEESIWGSISYLRYKGVRVRYQRATPRRTAARIILRTASEEIHEFYTQPTLVHFLELLGGLYTSAGITFALCLWCMFSAHACCCAQSSSLGKPSHAPTFAA